MVPISLFLNFNDLFEETPQSINFYLSQINRDELIDYASKLLGCTVLTSIQKPENLFWAFLTNNERELIQSLSKKIIEKQNLLKTNFTIINTRACIKFFEYAYNINNTECPNLSDSEKNILILKAFLVINNEIFGEEKPVLEKEFNLIIIQHALKNDRFNFEDLIHLRLSQLIKACLFFEFCDEKLPDHQVEFLKFYGVQDWRIYILHLHQLGLLINKRNLEAPYVNISIPISDSNFIEKKNFIEQFCLTKIGWNDDPDFTFLKDMPIIKTGDNKYRIIFDLFFLEKVYQSLYFKFNKINDSFKGNTNSYIKNLRGFITSEFSEIILTNKILLKISRNKGIHLGKDKLTNDGDIDYYIRNGKYIFLFECKDNYVSKEILEECNVDKFSEKLKELFVETNTEKKKKDKAVKQLVNNIEKVFSLKFIDKAYKPKNCIIYPTIVVHNSLFSLSGINSLINEWFLEELKRRDIPTTQIKPLTIIDIDTLVVFQGIFSQKDYSLKNMIDKYWKNYDVLNKKKYNTKEEFISNSLRSRFSFKLFCEEEFQCKNIFTSEINQYNKFFKQDN